MQPLLKHLHTLQADVLTAYTQLAIDAKVAQANDVEAELAQPEIWNNPTYAQEKSKQLAALNTMAQPWVTLKAQVSDIAELMELGDESWLTEFKGQVEALDAEFASRKKELLFNGQYDDHNAIIRISAGVGGTDAQDFAEMLERMYLRVAERSSIETSIVTRSAGEDAGVKTSVIE